MDNIDKRAKEKAMKVFPCPNEYQFRSTTELAFAEGARSQMKIDLEIVEDVLSTRPYLENTLEGIMNEIRERLA